MKAYTTLTCGGQSGNNKSGRLAFDLCGVPADNTPEKATGQADRSQQETPNHGKRNSLMNLPSSIRLKRPMLATLFVILVSGEYCAADDATSEKLLFVSFEGGPDKISVHSTNADGTGRTRIKTGEGIALDPALSPDGKQIVYSLLNEKAMKADLHVINADGSGDKLLTKVQDKEIAFGPNWSLDGKRLVYAVMRAPEGGPPGNGTIYVINADGQNAKKLGEGILPALSPDGKKILYTALGKDQEFNPRLHVMDADGKNDKELLKGRSMLGAYSPDGKRIAYMGAKEGNEALPHIYVCNADGSQPTPLTNDEAAFELAPRWSANGKRIYFNRMLREQGPDKVGIYVMDADGKDVKRLSKEGASEILGGGPLFLLTRTQSRQQ
jgi:Tol biopolymer transport system component